LFKSIFVPETVARMEWAFPSLRLEGVGKTKPCLPFPLPALKQVLPELIGRNGSQKIVIIEYINFDRSIRLGRIPCSSSNRLVAD
jgi:hypothetical protein